MNLLDATLTAWIIEGADVFVGRGPAGFCTDHGLSHSTANRQSARIRERSLGRRSSKRTGSGDRLTSWNPLVVLALQFSVQGS